jgi:hypothetical protein
VLPRLEGGRWGVKHGERCTAGRLARERCTSRSGAWGVGSGRKDLNLGG